MKAAMLMDLRMLTINPAVFIVYLIVGVGMGLVSNSVYTAGSVVLSIILLGNAVGFPVWDEQDGWESARLALPLSRADVVRGRYAAIACLVPLAFVMALIAMIATYVIAFVFLPESDITKMVLLSDMVLESILVTLVVASLVFVLVGIAYPVTYRFGIAKAGRILTVIMALLLVASIALFGSIGKSEAIAPLLESDVLSSGPLVMVAILLVVALIIFVGSCAISSCIYKKREF